MFCKNSGTILLDEIAPEVYFERLISHLRISAGRHTFDKGVATKLDHLLEVDLIAAAVRSWMLNPLFRCSDPGRYEIITPITDAP
jgi:hypothetical protein